MEPRLSCWRIRTHSLTYSWRRAWVPRSDPDRSMFRLRATWRFGANHRCPRTSTSGRPGRCSRSCWGSRWSTRWLLVPRAGSGECGCCPWSRASPCLRTSNPWDSIIMTDLGPIRQKTFDSHFPEFGEDEFHIRICSLTLGWLFGSKEKRMLH